MTSLSLRDTIFVFIDTFRLVACRSWYSSHVDVVAIWRITMWINALCGLLVLSGKPDVAASNTRLGVLILFYEYSAYTLAATATPEDWKTKLFPITKRDNPYHIILF